MRLGMHGCRLKVSKQTLIDWSKEFSSEIANIRGAELEALYDSYYLLKEHRLKVFGGLLDKIKTELLNRNLKDVPTDKLLELLLKYDSHIKEEFVEPVFKTSGEIQEEREDIEALIELIDPEETNKKLKVI
mgnify:FL=1